MKYKRLYYNAIAGFTNQVVTLVCTFILPRQILLYYGSGVNGLISSITQFLGFIALVEMGIGAVVQTSLYKPLVSNDTQQISKILKSAQNFFNKLALILICYIIGLCLFYPLITHSEFSYSFVIPLILSISINLFANYYFSLTRVLLLNADQRAYINLILNSTALILNTIIGVVLIHSNASIQIVQFVMANILLIRPIGVWLFTKKYYKVQKNVVLLEEPIRQKYNGLAQHISSFVLSHSAIMILTFFSSLEMVSVYSIYYMVIAGIRRFLCTAMTGFDSLFGQLYASKNPSLIKVFAYYEWFVHTGVSLIFTVTSLLIVPFVMLYTSKIIDVNYSKPLFSDLLLFAYVMYTIRLPYISIIFAAGHYKQTQYISILEAILNIIVSIICVQIWGLCGVALGIATAMTYSTIAMAYYSHKNILYRSFGCVLKHYVVDVLIIISIIVTTKWLVYMKTSYIAWTIMATKVTFIALAVTLSINLIFYRSETNKLFKKVYVKFFLK